MTWPDHDALPTPDGDGDADDALGRGDPSGVGPEDALDDAFGRANPYDDSIDDAWGGPDPQRWPLDWRGLYPRERWLWFERLWEDVCALRDRYRLAVRSRWWEDAVQVEALAALSAWTARYDSGEWDDPPGKLALLFELPQIESLLRDSGEPFQPWRDRSAFERHLVGLGCESPPVAGGEGHHG